MKTEHNKRNQADIIIRHNYMAVGLSRRGGQDDGGSSRSKIVNKREISAEDNMLCLGLSND